tara:strand:+ start:25123 stop:25953 length:831 start_codon:yes stop_codon:yes gene_type:complete
MLTINNIIPLFTSSLTIYESREIKSIAYIVIEELFGFNKSQTIINANYLINLNQENKILEILKKLNQNIPIQYILGKTSFYNSTFFVNNHTLIPRPETEELVKWILDFSFNNVLDVGTGTGCIPITLALNSDAKISALDISSEALLVAEKNCNHYNINLNLICSNIFHYKTEEKFDLIISNPPYVLNSEKTFMHKNVIDNEPHLALFVDDNNPLIYYKYIIEFSSNSLLANGLLFFEINERFAFEIISILKDYNFVNIELKKDINGKDRMIKASKK